MSIFKDLKGQIEKVGVLYFYTKNILNQASLLTLLFTYPFIFDLLCRDMKESKFESICHTSKARRIVNKTTQEPTNILFIQLKTFKTVQMRGMCTF